MIKAELRQSTFQAFFSHHAGPSCRQGDLGHACSIKAIEGSMLYSSGYASVRTQEYIPLSRVVDLPDNRESFCNG